MYKKALLSNELKIKGSYRLNSILKRNGALDDDIIIRLYFNDWLLIQSIKGFGKRMHVELKSILNSMIVGV